MHDYTTTTYGMLLQHGDRSPQKKATLTSNIGVLRPGKRSQHQKKPALTKFNGAHLLKWLAAFYVLDRVGAAAPAPPSPPQCNAQDGSVTRDGVIVDASLPCNWGLTEAAATLSASCAGAELLAAIGRKEVDRQSLQLVLVRHTEDISWSDPFAAVRTVYEKPGKVLPMSPQTPPSATAVDTVIPADAPKAASVVLPNVGREQHAYLTHIVRNYDSLADRTVFMHGKRPTCGFFLVDPSQVGNHMLTNVSALDYFLAEGDLYMPLTGRANHDLTLSSVRSTFADGLDPRPRVSRPVAAYPTCGDEASSADVGGGDHWLEWEVNDLPKHAKELTLKQGALPAEEMVDFDAFFRRVVGRPPPAVLYFAQGAQFAASRAALHSTPKETYQWILELVEAGHFEVTFYLEIIWLYVLHGAPEADWAAIKVDRKEAVPFLDHLAEARLVLQPDTSSQGLADSHAEEQRRSLAASPEPEVAPPPPPPTCGDFEVDLQVPQASGVRFNGAHLVYGDRGVGCGWPRKKQCSCMTTKNGGVRMIGRSWAEDKGLPFTPLGLAFTCEFSVTATDSSAVTKCQINVDLPLAGGKSVTCGCTGTGYEWFDCNLGDGLGPNFDQTFVLAPATSLSSPSFYLTRHDTSAIDNVRGEIFDSKDEAFAKFDEYNGGPYATAVWDEQLGELRYYGNPDNPAWVKQEQKEWVMRVRLALAQGNTV